MTSQALIFRTTEQELQALDRLDIRVETAQLLAKLVVIYGLLIMQQESEFI